MLSMLRLFAIAAVLACSAVYAQSESKVYGDRAELWLGGSLWLNTLTPTFDPDRAEDTYKVYTHVYNFAGTEPITKGVGGKFTHHRGLFIGWKDTLVGGTDYDTWHMPNCYQRHAKWAGFPTKGTGIWQIEHIDWCALDGKPFITEVRSIGAWPHKSGARVIDFVSELTSRAGTIQLKGDLQHAGMQIRMAQEVAEHEDTTSYVLPQGAATEPDDKVTGAWWACCNCSIGGKTYSVIHMTHPSLGQVPVYSIRKYARFGAFWEPTLEEGKPQSYAFRVVVSETPLDQDACQRLYDAYAAKPSPTPGIEPPADDVAG